MSYFAQFLIYVNIIDRMLDDLEANVDRTDSKLSDAMRRMKKFARDTEGKSLVVSTGGYEMLMFRQRRSRDGV